jgi:hypothetical protein
MAKKPLYAGVYLAVITSHGHNLTREKHYPQFCANFSLEARYIDNEKDFATYNVTEPSFVDWTAQDEAADGYFCLFKSAEVFSEDTAIFTYKNLKDALGWDGLSFQPFEGETYVGKKVLIEIKENTYNGNTSLKVNGILPEDADPSDFRGGFSSLGIESAKALDSKLRFARPLPKAASARSGATAAAGKPAVSSRVVTRATKAPVEVAEEAGDDIPF